MNKKVGLSFWSQPILHPNKPREKVDRTSSLSSLVVIVINGIFALILR
jgi:hypothetical protein